MKIKEIIKELSELQEKLYSEENLSAIDEYHMFCNTNPLPDNSFRKVDFTVSEKYEMSQKQMDDIQKKREEEFEAERNKIIKLREEKHKELGIIEDNSSEILEKVKKIDEDSYGIINGIIEDDLEAYDRYDRIDKMLELLYLLDFKEPGK